jgi:hypothetical protein
LPFRCTTHLIKNGFVLTSTFIFRYLEGVIDVNAWLRNKKFDVGSRIGIEVKTKSDTIGLSIIAISIVHLLCAFIAYLFFNID